jgi:hypothetical protein
MSSVIRVPVAIAGFITWMGLAFGDVPTPRPLPTDPPRRLAPVSDISLNSAARYADEAFAAPTGVAIAGDRILLVDGMADHPIHVLDRRTGRRVASMGRHGEGPGEFQWPRGVEPADSEGNEFWVYDAALSRLTLVDVDSWVRGGASASRIVPVRSPAQVTNVVHDAAGRMYAAGFFAEGRIGRFEMDGTFERALGPLPTSRIEAPPSVLQHAYRGVLKADSRYGRLVMGNRHAGFLEVFGADGAYLGRASGPFEFEPVFQVEAGEAGPGLATGDDLRFGYVDVVPTSERIYALYSGRTRGASPETAMYGAEVHVFGWDGALQGVFHLDEDLMAIAIDDRSGRLVGVRHLPTPAIVFFEIPDLPA